MGGIRRRLMTQRDRNAEGGELPAGYYLCEYIESDGNQHINTRSEWNNQCRLVVDAEVSSSGCLFGVGEYDGGDAYIYELSVYTNTLILEYGVYGGSYTLAGAIGTRRVYDWNEKTLFINDSKFVTFKTSGSRVYSEPTLFAFARNDVEEGLDVYNHVSAKLYSCQMYNYNGKLLRDYIPCFSATDGKFGLYDRISKTFFGSETTFDFKGKLAVPSGYSAVEFIYGDGNAYIDSGFKHNQDTRVIADIEPIGTPTENKFLFEGFQADGYRKGIYWNYSDSSWSIDYASSSARKNINTAYAQRLYIDYNRNLCRVNDTFISFTAKTFQSTQNEYILAVNNNGTTTRITPAKLYFYCIFDNDTLVRLFAPCINPSNVYGLYDLVNKQFYQSAGSSQFGEVPVVYDFAYTGGMQSVTLDAGTYKLECWGAQGGGACEATGGKGGYSCGNLEISSPTELRIFVGGKGEGGKTSNTSATLFTSLGGYNGGGNGGSAYRCGQSGGGGGGKTHIVNVTRDMMILCAGGGGGAGGGVADNWSGEVILYEAGTPGGAGGGRTGLNGGWSYDEWDGYYGGYGKQTAGGGPGSGGDFSEFEPGDTDGTTQYYSGSGGGGGGGGGYYGGGGGGSGAWADIRMYDTGNAGVKGVYLTGGKGGEGVGGKGYDPSGNPGGGGGGGSAYANTLTSTSLIVGNTTMPSITGGTEIGHAGDGYARITKIA